MTGSRVENSLYRLCATTKNPTEPNEESSTALYGVGNGSTKASLELWHRRFGHLNCQDILKINKFKAVHGLHLNDVKKPLICEGCIFGKLHRSKFPTGCGRAENIGDLIHSDVGGPLHVPTPEGHRFFVIFKDDNSSYTVVKLMKTKNEAGTHFMEFAEMMKTQTGRPIKILRTDQGTDILGGNFSEYKKRTGLIHQTTARYTPQQNSRSERTMRTVVEAVRSGLYTNDNSNQLPCNIRNEVRELWGEFLLSIVYIFNRTLTSHTEVTPFEKLFGKKPSVAHLRVLGCRAYAHVPDQLRKKLDPKGEACWMVGYGENQKAWRLWNPVERKIIVSRDVTFDETILIGDHPLTAEKGNSQMEPMQLLVELLNQVSCLY